MSLSPGAKFRLAIEQNNPLQIVGTINPYCAMMAKTWVTKLSICRVAASPMHLTVCQILALRH